jgi:hypothetical protein
MRRDLYNHAWITPGTLIRSLKEKQHGGSWDRSYRTTREEQGLNDG